MPYGSVAYGTPTYGEGVMATPATPTSVAGFPNLAIEIAFTTAPLSASPVWVDVTAYARAGTTRRGRSDELDHVSAGTLDLTLSNIDRRFDPLNTGSPYYPNLTPNKRIRVRATYEAVTYPIFDGFVEDFEQDYALGDHEATCRITASDAFSLFANIGIPADARPAEAAGLRVAAILINTRLVYPIFGIDPGSSVCVAEELLDVKVLDALFEVDSTEQGRMFIAANGELDFRDRNTLVTNPTYTTDQVTFGDDLTGAEVPYTDLAFDHGSTLIRNAITVDNPVWGTFYAEDTTSELAYGTRTYDVTVIDATPQASQQTADNLLRLYKDPQSRVKTLKVNPKHVTTGWPTGTFAGVLSLELGWRVGVKRRGSTYTIDQHYSVESITHEFVAKDRSWRCEFGFGLPQTTEAYWIWGTALWGSTTRWAW